MFNYYQNSLVITKEFVYLYHAIKHNTLIKFREMKTLATIKNRDKRRNFCIEKDLLKYLDKEIEEKELISLIESLGIKVSMFLDPDVKDEFFELTGLSYNSVQVSFEEQLSGVIKFRIYEL